MDKSALINQLQLYLSEKVDPQANIKIIDETSKHQKHRNYTKGKYYFLLELNSNKLNSMNRISAHKSIYKAISEFMPFIHALSINIKPEQN